LIHKSTVPFIFAKQHFPKILPIIFGPSSLLVGRRSSSSGSRRNGQSSSSSGSGGSGPTRMTDEVRGIFGGNYEWHLNIDFLPFFYGIDFFERKS